MPLDGFLRFNKKVTRYIQTDKGDQIIKVHANDIVRIIKAQLASGIDGTGMPIYLMRNGQKRNTYAFSTIKKKLKYGVGLGGVVDRITLYKTGTFYKSIFLKTYKGGAFEIMSRDPKFPILESRSGPNLLELSPQAIDFTLKQQIARELQVGINAIFLKQI